MNGNLFWVGIRQSEISMIKNLFKGSVCLFGNAAPDNYVFAGERCNQNFATAEMTGFYVAAIRKIIADYPDCKFMFYNQNKAYIFGDDITCRSICCNNKMLLDNLNDKIWVRKIYSQIVNSIPSIETNYSLHNCESLFNTFDNVLNLIIQKPVSGGGTGTFVFNRENKSDIDKILKNGEKVMISPYIENSFSVNSTIVLGDKNFILLPPSVQIIERIENRLLYRGADYIAFSRLLQTLKESVKQASEKIAKYTKSLGYRGIFGVDFLIDDNNKLYFLEINDRFQASSDLINNALAAYGTSLQELNLQAFSGNILPDIDIEIKLSSYSYYNETECDFEDLKRKYFIYDRLKNESEFQLVLDGYCTNTKISDKCYGFKVNFKKQICMPSPDGQLWINENVRYINPKLTDLYQSDILKLKTALLNQGVYLENSNSTDIKSAVYCSIDLKINYAAKTVTLNCPFEINFSSLSPFSISENNKLMYAGQPLCDVVIDKNKISDDAKTTSGKKINRVIYMSEDRLRIKTMSGCDYKRKNIGCDFCNNPSVCDYFDIEDITESINYAYLQYGKKIRHFLIGGGTDFRENYWVLIEQIVNFIHSKEYLPQEISLMVAPFDIAKLDALKNLGISDLSVNIEIFDNEMAIKLMKGKGVKRQIYFNFFKAAKKFWPEYGNLRSMIMVGLDKSENLFKLVKLLVQNGIQPVLSIFRPLPQTPMENCIMPPNDYLETVYYVCSEICRKENSQYSLGPKCRECKNNVLAI